MMESRGADAGGGTDISVCARGQGCPCHKSYMALNEESPIASAVGSRNQINCPEIKGTRIIMAQSSIVTIEPHAEAIRAIVSQPRLDDTNIEQLQQAIITATEQKPGLP